MYPTAPPDDEKYATDHNHQNIANPVPAPGLNNPSVLRTYTPPPYAYNTQPSGHVRGNWSTGLCHCFDDPANCMITAFCPCITFGQIAEIVSQGSTSCASQGVCYGILLATTANACLYSCFYRSRLRGQYDLEEAPCVDCLVHFCCATCALCQEYRELRNRGFDMGIAWLIYWLWSKRHDRRNCHLAKATEYVIINSWEANMDRRRRGVTAAPTVVPGMTR